MAMEELAEIARVDPRDIWPNEAANFTPWLAENLSILGDALGGMQLEMEAREAPVGGYKLDILARDIGSGHSVVIENQLGDTDHTHLGQLLTYMAGFDANVIVWIAKAFRDEHREALDMLNHRTGEDTQFFGIEVELWKIDDSRPAVNFKLVATPNEWRKQAVSERKPGEASERMERYRTFFQKLIDTLREEHSFTNARKGQPQSWYQFSIGYGHQAKLGAAFIVNGRARVEVYLDGNRDANKRLFDQLLEEKNAIESGTGSSLEWERLDESKASRIGIVRRGTIDDGEESLEEIQSWMIQNLLEFKRVFGPRLDNLIPQL